MLFSECPPIYALIVYAGGGARVMTPLFEANGDGGGAKSTLKTQR